MQMQTQLLAGRADGLEFFGLVDAADFSGLSEGHNPRLGVVNVLTLERHFTDRFRGQLAACAAGGQQLGAVGKEFRRAAFISFDVSRFRADDTVVTLAQR